MAAATDRPRGWRPPWDLGCVLGLFALFLFPAVKTGYYAEDLIHSMTPGIARLDEPIDQELDLDVFHAIVVENAPHLGQRVARQHSLEIRMPQAHAFEAGTRGGLDLSLRRLRARLSAHEEELL